MSFDVSLASPGDRVGYANLLQHVGMPVPVVTLDLPDTWPDSCRRLTTSEARALARKLVDLVGLVEGEAAR